MKKIILFIIAFLPILAHAENMCIKNGSVMVVLDPQIAGTALASDATGKTWSTKFSYGVISGITACYTNVGATQGMVATDQTMTVSSTGTYCYCKMLRPVESPWVFNASHTNCATYCAPMCASYAGSDVALRRGLFGNIIE